jgi:hypothetical protein
MKATPLLLMLLLIQPVPWTEKEMIIVGPNMELRTTGRAMTVMVGGQRTLEAIQTLERMVEMMMQQR